MWGSIGVALSDAIRIQLIIPNSMFLSNNGQLYNTIITAHALAMIFFFVMPVFIGALANYLVPMLNGTADMANFSGININNNTTCPNIYG
jgi:cytochrome c oxidase subunit 1